MNRKNRPPDTCRHCRIGHHRGCTAPDTCACRICHLPELLDIDDSPEAAWEDQLWSEAKAELEQAKACLYALEARAQLALAASDLRRMAQLVGEMRDTARSCLTWLDNDDLV